MVVDDDLSIAAATAQILEHFGYTTEAFGNSFQALEAIRSSPGKWNLLVTDQRMPVLSGPQLARAAREACADLPVILTSGFPSSLGDRELAHHGIRAFLQKPFSRQDLIATIEATLAG